VRQQHDLSLKVKNQKFILFHFVSSITVALHTVIRQLESNTTENENADFCPHPREQHCAIYRFHVCCKIAPLTECE